MWSARLRSVYAIGSVARGGFSPVMSDIDMVFIVEDPLSLTDARRRDEVVARVAQLSLEFGDRVAAFWSSPCELSRRDASGRYPPENVRRGHLPPFDRLDLLLCGVLVWGREVREMVARPTRAALDVGSAEFALSFLRSLARLERLTDPAAFGAVAGGAFAKAVLLPVRLLYGLSAGLVGTSEEAVALYVDECRGHHAPLVRLAMSARTDGVPLVAETACALALASVVDLYVEVIDAYTSRMDELGREDLGRELCAWRTALLQAEAAPNWQGW